MDVYLFITTGEMCSKVGEWKCKALINILSPVIGARTMYPPGEMAQYGQNPMALAPANQAEQQEVDTEMGPSVMIMKPILRFLQLLCENHNLDLQVSHCFICFHSRSLFNILPTGFVILFNAFGRI